MEQDAHNTWHLSQAEFCQGLNQVTEDGQGKDLTPNEMHQCRAILGAAQWRCYQTAPQHAAKLSHLQSLLPRGDRTTLKDVNKFVREIYHLKDEKVSVYDLKAENDSDIIAVGWSDAALANRVDLSSTGGYVIGFTHRKMLRPVSLVSWSTHKLRRVCRSSLAAEAQALAECEAELFLVRGLWQELLGAELDLANPRNTTKQTPGVLVIDAKALYDTLKQQEVPNLGAKEKHTALEVLGLCQHLVEQETTLRWCNSDQQLADGMTKISAQDRVTQFLKGNQRWNLVYDETFTAAKKLKSAKTAEDCSSEYRDQTWLEVLNQTSGHAPPPPPPVLECDEGCMTAIFDCLEEGCSVDALLKLDQKLAEDEKKIVSTVKEIQTVQKTAFSPENAGTLAWLNNFLSRSGSLRAQLQALQGVKDSDFIQQMVKAAAVAFGGGRPNDYPKAWPNQPWSNLLSMLRSSCV
eukprot:s1261_g9.t1